MKSNRLFTLLLCAGIVLINTPSIVPTVYAKSSTDTFAKQLSKIISDEDSDNYIGSVKLTIGSSDMSVDGETTQIDDDGSVPVIENDTTLLPIRGVAEAIGAEVDFDDSTKTVSLTNDETEVNMTLGSKEMEVNGDVQLMSVEAKTVNDRTLIPLRSATEALGCDVSWDGGNQTILLTRPYQTKRVIVFSENANTEDATAVATGDGKTVLQFKTEQEARDCVEVNKAKGLEAEPDYICKPDSLSWGTDRLNAPVFYNAYSSKQSDLIVAVIDSGLDSSNSCFNNKVVQGYDFYDGDSIPNDECGHGTHVASTVADMTAGFGRVKIMPLRTSGANGSSSSSSVEQALKYAVDHGAKVINLSMGGYHRSESMRRGVEYAISKGATVVAAAGNDNVNIAENFFSPACINGVVGVAAINSNNQKANFSNYGYGMIDVAAPGVGINGAARGGGTTIKYGTSMASPHVAGAIALIRSANSNYSSDEAINTMKNSCTYLGDATYFGSGLPNLANLVSGGSGVTVNTLDATNVSETNATVNGKVAYSGTRPSEVGIYFGSSEGGMSKVAKDRINHNKNPFDMWYDLNKEAKVTLSPNSTYYYQCYAIVNGAETKGEVKSFHTTGSTSSSLSVTTGGADTISGTNATVRGSASYSGNRPSEVGLYFGTSPDNMSRVAKDSINHKKNPFDIWYDLNSEAGQYLSPGTTYYYRIYGIQNGNEVSGETKSFTTTASSSDSLSVNTGGADSISSTNATVRGSASYSGSRPSEVGLYFGTSPDNMSKVARDSINHNKNPFDIWYDLNAEAGQYLSASTTYYYRIYGIQNGNEVSGETKSFTTISGEYTRIGIIRGTDGSLVINSRPHKGYDIGYIPEGASVTVYPDKTSGNWYWVSYNGVSGYSYKDYIILQ